MDLKEVMAVNLRRLRHEKGMTQEELADRAGLSVRYIGAIERANVSASVTIVGQIAEALAVEPGELLKRSRRKVELGHWGRRALSAIDEITRGVAWA